MNTLKERYRPRTLSEVIGQPCIGQLRALVREPSQRCVLLEGATGTGKSAAAHALAHDLGCYSDPLMDFAYTVCASDFHADAVRYYFGPWRSDEKITPLAYKAPGKGFHALILEELEYMHPAVQVLCKDALERKLGGYKLIVVATSNDVSKLPPAVLHRFANDHYVFDSGPGFAEAFNDHLPQIWAAEFGPDVDMPYGWQAFGWYGEPGQERFSGRLALDMLNKHATVERNAREEVVAA